MERYEIDALTEAILDGVSPRTLTGVVNRLLIEAQIGDFFAITTSLCEANRLKSTVEVETPSGEVSTTYPESSKLIMYASSVPSFDDEKKEDDSWDERLNWDNPDNFTDSDTDTDETI